jgi:hypothetical protein
MADLEEIAGELYRLRPEEFAAARDEEIRKARATKDLALVKELGKLRRPTQSAWLINQLLRAERKGLEGFLKLAEELGEAQASGSLPDLQRLSSRRRQMEDKLIRRARALGDEAGVSVTAATEREVHETLGAALALPEVADEVRSGRLVKPASYAGFGVAPVAVPERPPPAPKEPKRDERREDRVREAMAALDAAEASLAEAERHASQAEERHSGLREKLQDLETEVRRVRGEMLEADRDAASARRRRDAAAKEHAAAQKALERVTPRGD